ncbi:DNA polymerase III subunit beta [compost metagenome]
MPISPAKKIEIINKHAKNYTTKPNGSTPVLEGVHYSADGSVIATDRHTLIRIGHAHGFTQAFTSHAKTGAAIDGQYPDTSRIIPMELPTQITLISDRLRRDDIKDAIARTKVALEAAKLSGGKSYIARLTLIGSDVRIAANDDNAPYRFSAGLSAEIFGPDAEVSFNAEYLLNALNVFKDAGSKRVIIGITGAYTPIVLRDEENEIDIVVLPFRVAKEAA